MHIYFFHVQKPYYVQEASFDIQCFNANDASENGSAQSNGVTTNGDHTGTVLDIPQDKMYWDDIPLETLDTLQKGFNI